MSVSYVLEIPGRTGSVNLTKNKSTTNYARLFRVFCTDAVNDDAYVAAAGLFASVYGIVLGIQYPYDTTAYCNNISARLEGRSKLVWVVTGTYLSEFEFAENPLDDPAIIEWSSIPYQREYHRSEERRVGK